MVDFGEIHDVGSAMPRAQGETALAGVTAVQEPAEQSVFQEHEATTETLSGPSRWSWLWGLVRAYGGMRNDHQPIVDRDETDLRRRR